MLITQHGVSFRPRLREIKNVIEKYLTCRLLCRFLCVQREIFLRKGGFCQETPFLSTGVFLAQLNICRSCFSASHALCSFFRLFCPEGTFPSSAHNITLEFKLRSKCSSRYHVTSSLPHIGPSMHTTYFAPCKGVVRLPSPSKSCKSEEDYEKVGDPPSFPLLSPSLLALLTFPSGLFLPREPTSSLSLIPRPTLHYYFYYQRAQGAL